MFTIRPKTDITAIATFDDGLLERAVPVNPDTSPVSPKTGDDRTVIFIVLALCVFLSGCAIIMSWDNNKPKH